MPNAMLHHYLIKDLASVEIIGDITRIEIQPDPLSSTSRILAFTFTCAETLSASMVWDRPQVDVVHVSGDYEVKYTGQLNHIQHVGSSTPYVHTYHIEMLVGQVFNDVFCSATPVKQESDDEYSEEDAKRLNYHANLKQALSLLDILKNLMSKSLPDPKDRSDAADL